MSTLSTHVLDTANGRPGNEVEVELYQGDVLVFTGKTNVDGRCPELAELELSSGQFRLVFGAGAYFRRTVPSLPDPAFLDRVVVDFGMASEDEHYHVPLLVSPFGYSTYRGS